MSLKSEPDRLQNAIKLFANLMVPKSQHDDSVLSKECRPGSIVSSAHRIIVSATIQFDRELCRPTVEIQDVTIEWVLPPKFVTCKVSVS
jgi:hypothetical protein